jgi:hypothetical protein
MVGCGGTVTRRRIAEGWAGAHRGCLAAPAALRDARDMPSTHRSGSREATARLDPVQLTGALMVEHCDIPPDVTLTQWRDQRCRDEHAARHRFAARWAIRRCRRRLR